MNEFAIQGVSYRARPLGALKELNVCRRLTGVLGSLDPKKLDDPIALGMSMVSYIGEIPQADFDYITKTCLPTVTVIDGSGRASPFASPNGDLMDETTPMMTLVMVLFEVLKKPVTDFFAFAQQSSPPTEAASITTE